LRSTRREVRGEGKKKGSCLFLSRRGLKARSAPPTRRAKKEELTVKVRRKCLQPLLFTKGGGKGSDSNAEHRLSYRES